MSKQDDGVETKTTPKIPEHSEESETVKSPEEETKDGEELSRRQRLAKEKEELEKRNREYEERLKRLESQVNKQEESKIVASLKSELNIDSYDEDVFNEVRGKLSNLPPEEAVEMALLKASKKQVRESEEEKERSEERKATSLPPYGSAMKEERSEFALLPKEEYSSLIANRGVEYFKKYNDYWKARGKEQKPYID